MSKVLFKDDYFELTKEDLIETILIGFLSQFGFKPPKSILKIKFCYPEIRVYSDGDVDHGFICEFIIVPGDGRGLRYRYSYLEAGEHIKRI